MFKGYEIIKCCCVLSSYHDYTKEANLIKYAGTDSTVLDIRKWDRTPYDEPKLLKGITLSMHEAKALYEALSKVNFDEY